MAHLHGLLSAAQARGFPMILLLLLLAPMHCQAGTYSEMKSLYDTLLASSNYNPQQRPLLDQSDTLYVNVQFIPVSIVEINDLFQSFRCNGFLGLSWKDEILRWNASDYGGEIMISPKMTSIFRPRIVMMNTIGERDLFEDDYAPFNVYADGMVTWGPGSIFPASCQLDLTKYPFDEQHCEIELLNMNYDATEVQYVIEDTSIPTMFLTKNGQWDILNMSITTPVRDIGEELKSTIIVRFDVKRKPTFLIISMVLPIIFLSLLNLLVFVIPVDSGEKISYGITVLLALSVFLSIMSSMLPSSSESMPLMISYIFILMTISVLTVVTSVVIVRLHHKEEKEEKSQKAKANFKSVLPKISLLKRAVDPLQPPTDCEKQSESGLKPLAAESKVPLRPVVNDEPKVNNYKIIGRYIDMVSLAVFGLIWVSVTLGFMVAIAG